MSLTTRTYSFIAINIKNNNNFESLEQSVKDCLKEKSEPFINELDNILKDLKTDEIKPNKDYIKVYTRNGFEKLRYSLNLYKKYLKNKQLSLEARTIFLQKKDTVYIDENIAIIRREDLKPKTIQIHTSRYGLARNNKILQEIEKYQ